MGSENQVLDDDFLFYSLLYSSITVAFAMAVLSNFLTSEIRFGFRSSLSLIILFIGEPMCQFLLKGPTGVILFGLGCFLVYLILPASHLPADKKTVLITGCDSGYGQALVKKLDSIGMHVFAGCLHSNGQGATDLRNYCSQRMKIIEIDVTDEQQIKEAFRIVSQNTGTEGLWGLVNNTGISYVSPLEMIPIKIFYKTLDVNLIGIARMTQTFLPLIKRAKGRIVNMSCSSAKVPLENFGVHCVSKSAVDTYSDVLRLEMKKWGVRVSVVQPAACTAGYMSEGVIHEHKDEIWKKLDIETKNEYGSAYFEEMLKICEAINEKSHRDIDQVVRTMKSALLSKKPRNKYPCGLGTETLLTVFPVLPVWLADKLSGTIGTVIPDVNPVALQK